MNKILININIETDGDIEFKNDDNFFSEGFEEYSISKIVSKEELLNTNVLHDIFKEINERVFNRYNQKEGLVDFFKYISPEKGIEHYSEDKHPTYKSESYNPIQEFRDFDFVGQSYISGNQDFYLQISEIVLPEPKNIQEKIQKSLEKLSKNGLRYAQIFSNISTLYKKDNKSIDSDIFNLSDKDTLKYLNQMIENLS